ncbi:helix-turn-helix transcriptional regulator [bacterium]|nr:helix-turn-helix transcriptional regulator [bacterium]
MPHSAALRLADLQAVFQLVGECRELGDEPARWHNHLFAGLARLTGGGVVMGGELVGVRTGRTAYVGAADWGWENGFNRVGWERALAELRDNPQLTRTMTVARYVTRTAECDGACLARTDLIADRDWDRAWDFRNIVEPAGADHSVYCFRSIPGLMAQHTGVIIARALRQSDFTVRQKEIVREAMAAIAPLVGGPLARLGEPSPRDLPPRGRQVLRCLLEGDSDKDVANRLGLTRNTVNQYAKVIFALFGVRSRAELLARWVRRGWGGRFAWSE